MSALASRPVEKATDCLRRVAGAGSAVLRQCDYLVHATDSLCAPW